MSRWRPRRPAAPLVRCSRSARAGALGRHKGAAAEPINRRNPPDRTQAAPSHRQRSRGRRAPVAKRWVCRATRAGSAHDRDRTDRGSGSDAGIGDRSGDALRIVAELRRQESKARRTLSLHKGSPPRARCAQPPTRAPAPVEPDRDRPGPGARDPGRPGRGRACRASAAPRR